MWLVCPSTGRPCSRRIMRTSSWSSSADTACLTAASPTCLASSARPSASSSARRSAVRVVVEFVTALRRRRIPPIGAAGDGFVVGHDQVQVRVGQCLLGRFGQDAVDSRLRQPNLGLVLLTQLAVHHAAHIRQVGDQQRDFGRPDRRGQHVGVEAARRVGLPDHVDPVEPVQRDPALPEMRGGVGRQRADRRCHGRHDDRLRGQFLGGRQQTSDQRCVVYIKNARAS